MLREIRDLGFDYAELSHGIRISLLPGILEAVKAGDIKISTLHNFCPLPMGVDYAAPNIFKFTAEESRERENAYKHTIKTIEMAARLGATLVVLHMGKITMPSHTSKLTDLLEKNMRDSDEYASLCASVLEKRQLRRDIALQRAAEMLTRLADKAEEHGIRLGIENRERLEEIPLEEDFAMFLDEFNRPGVAYWHDTGHAQIKENLGFLNHMLYLETMAPRLAGFHVHDVVAPAQDHSEPGTGTVDFVALKQFLKPGQIRVFELSPALKPEEVRRGTDYVFKVWGKE
jgi:sugar phosphate isomerase/epimerase